MSHPAGAAPRWSLAAIWTRSRANILWALFAVALAGLLYGIHAAYFGDYIIDDAGISFVYARNLAEGHGLVSQPGRIPVEGYSNTSWVLLLLAPFFLFGVFDPVVTPKLVSALLVLASFVAIIWFLRRLLPAGRAWLVAGAVLALLAINTSFVVWTIAGLENALYVLLVCLLLGVCLGDLAVRPGVYWPAIWAAIFALGAALTRPEAVVWAALPPLVWLARSRQEPRVRRGVLLRRVGLYLAVFVVAYLGFIAFRLGYFGDVVPNTFYAKGGPQLYPFTIAAKLVGLLVGVLGPYYRWICLAIAIMIVGLFFARRLNLALRVLAVPLIIQTLLYAVMPADGIAEFRFATPFFVFFYAFLALFVLEFADLVLQRLKIERPMLRLSLVLVLFMVFFFGSLSMYTRRSVRYENSPYVPFSGVSERFGVGYNNVAAMFKVTNGSLLAPDVGGTLYYSNLTIYDLGMLTDKKMPRALRSNTAGDYIFDELKPTFIHTHGLWTFLFHLDTDPRLQRDYTPICEVTSSQLSQPDRLKNYGDYIRKEIATTNPTTLSQARGYERQTFNLSCPDS